MTRGDLALQGELESNILYFSRTKGLFRICFDDKKVPKGGQYLKKITFFSFISGWSSCPFSIKKNARCDWIISNGSGGWKQKLDDKIMLKIEKEQQKQFSDPSTLPLTCVNNESGS